MDEMQRIVICKYCGRPEYLGVMVSLIFSGCRDCYKSMRRNDPYRPYIVQDFGERPTMEEYQEQESEERND